MGSIVDLFAKCAAHHASRPALEDWTKGPSSLRQYTYREIDIASSNFCQRLRRHGLRKGDRIPLLAARSPAMVVAVLAILKLGACYVPVDLSSWGPERIETTLEIVGAKTLVCTEELGAPLAGYEMIRFTNEDMVFDEHDVDIVVEDAPSPDDLAYIIFTSGSTGKPKGVVVAHRSMANYARSNGQESSFNVKVTARSRILMLFSIAFDGCAGVLFSTLCNGGCLVIASPATFAKAAQTCTELPLTPSILMALDPNSGYDSVESVLLGGEKPSEALVNAWASPTRKVWNAYGPTEATCVTLMAELQPESPIVLGYPVNNTSVVLLDESGNEADEGEICIGGLGLAVGYFNDPERTEKAFVTHKGQRIYKSGDFGKMTPAGITFAGRKDSLVKNRGFLVNLETEVEPALLSVGSVTAAAALMERGRLHAFVTPSGADDGLRERLLQEYSSFLVPDNIVALDQLPMTSNGKIDLKALRSLVVDDSEDMVRSGEDLSPVQAVMEVFRTTLGVRLTDISSDTSFRDLGGHSLAAVRITTTLRKYSYSITVPQIFSLDTVEAISDALTKLTVEATANLSQSIEDEQALWKPVEHHFGKKPASVFKVAPMTEMQLRMVHGTIESPTVNYIRVSATFDLRNGLDVASKLKEAWYAAISQHEICRTTFLLSEGAGVQLIHDEASVDWTEHFIQDDDDFEEACRKLDNWEDSDPVALQLPHIHSLSSVQLLTVPNNRTRLTWTVHHSLTDGWSIASFVNDFAFAAGGAAIPPRPSFPTVSTAIKSLQASQANEARNYWASKIGQLDVVPRLTLPQSSTPTSSRQSEKSIALRITSADLEQVAQVAKVTPAAIFYGAWAVILSKYCATKDVIMGAVLAGRNIPVEGIAEVCGPLLSTLPLRVHLGSAESSFELLQDVFASLCEMSNYQTSSNALIQSATGTKATDLFETLLALQYDFPEATWPSTDVPAPYDVRATETSELPLSVLIESSDGALEARFIYRHDRFEAATVERMSQHFENALFSMVEGTWNRAMGEISNAMMSPVEQRLLVDGFEGLREPYVGPRTLKAAFGEAAKRFATLPALEAGKFSITYEELDRRSDVVASKLLSTESQSKFIAVLADGSIGWIVAILAVLKTGAAYLPLDHKIAHERQRLMLELAETDLVLYPSEASVTHRVEGVTALAVDTMLEEAFDVDVGMILQDDVPADDDVVCLIFTSGSTGIPKGVQLQNSGILSCLANPIARAHTVPGQRNAQVVAYGFDICVMEIFSTLLYGGVFVLKDENDPLGHLRSVDAAFITPSMLGTLDHNAYSNLQIITLVGEGAPQTIVDKWGRDRYIINAYGPAEATLSVNYSYCHVGKPINAGRPLPRMASYVLDEDNQPVPVGCTGEILLSGVQVTPGYLKLPEKTQQVFSPDPFHPDLAMTMYRTGDIGRWTPDMELQVIGRTDNQVKVRGSRVDILDVEAMIRRAYPTVESVAVVLSSNSLIAYVTPIDVDVRALKTAVQANLPYYCQPNRFVLMSQLPLNQNHKVNRKALEALEVDIGSADSTPLETDTERLVAKVWRETLATSGGEQRVHNIGALDSFFDLGGHSLLQIKVAQQLSQALDRSVSLKTVIRHLVLRDLAAALDDNALSDSDTSGASAVSFLNAPLVEPRHVMPLSSLEAEFFETYMAAPGSGAFSMPFAFRVHGLFDHARFAQAFTDVMSKHPVLRSRYCLVDDKPARVLSDIIREPEILTCTTGAVDTLIQAEINAPFDLATDQPIRVKLFVENDTSTVVSITMSHIVGDATSLAVLLDQLTKSYASPSLSSVPPQAVPADRYATWTNWFSTQPPAPASTTSFWQQHLATATPNLLTSFTQRQPSHCGSYLHVPVPPRLRLALKRRAARSRVPPHTIALAAVGLTLATMTNLPAGHDIVLGAPYANRAEEGTGDVVGLLLDRVAIKIPFSSTTDAGEEGKKDKANIASLLAAIASSSQASLAHYVPLANVARAVSASPSHSPSQHTFSPLFDSMVTYHTAHETSTRVPHFSLPSSQPVDSDIQADVVTNGATQTQTVLLHAHARGAKYPLMFEFTESPCGGRLALDLEYDEAMFDGIVVDEIAKLVVAALELVVGEKETTVGEARERLGELWGLTGGREKVGDSGGAVVDMEMEEALPVVVAVEA